MNELFRNASLRLTLTVRSLALAIALALVASVALAQPASLPVRPGWVGLFSSDIIDWLENENRLDMLCGAVAGDSSKQLCWADHLKTRPYAAPLWNGPSETSQNVGTLLLLATPGKGLSFFYLRRGSSPPQEFEPDVNMQDWGYGPYFHQTFLDRKGDWFLLPESPFPSGTWFRPRDLGDEPQVLLAEGMVATPQGNQVILGVDADSVRARAEQPADKWCKEGKPPPLQPWTELRIPKKDWYSRTGHLLIRPAYMKGC